MRNLVTNKKASSLLTRIVLLIAMFVLMFMDIPQAKAQSYCSPYEYYPYYGYIQRFVFNGIDNPNNTYNYYGGYSDYSGSYISADCNPGQTYNFSVTGYSIWGSYAGLAIWVDWNQDGSFNNTDERMYRSTSAGGPSFSGSFTVPTTASPGNHRMRVHLGGYYYYFNYYQGDYPNCNEGAPYYCETEDYTLKVAAQVNDAGITAIPSPADGYRHTVPQTVTATIKNFSKKWHLQSCQVTWSVAGVAQTPYNWSGDLDTGATATVTLGTVLFTPVAPWNPIQIIAKTNNPKGNDATANSKPDGNAANDQWTKNSLPILNDAGFLNCDAMIPLQPNVNNVIATIKNYAPKPLSYVTINSWIQTVPQPAVQTTFGTPVAYNGTANVTLYQYNFGNANIPYAIKCQTSLPNGVVDEFPANDSGTVSVYKALPGGTYTIGATNSDYRDMQSFVDFINFWGVAGPVTVLFRPGAYTVGQTINPRGGLKFPVTFGSVTGSSYDVSLNYTATGVADNFLFNLTGMSNVTFQDLTFNANGATYATVFKMSGGNSNITIQRCIFNGKQGAAKNINAAIIWSTLNQVSNISIHDNVFNYGSTQIYMESPVGVFSSNVQMYNNSHNNYTWKGVYCTYINSCTIHDNTFYGQAFDYGIDALNCSTIQNNRINGATGVAVSPIQAGISVVHTLTAEPAVITGNTVAGVNIYGIYYIGTDAVTVNDNIVNINSTGLYSPAGIGVFNSTNAQIMRNQILTVNQDGLRVNGATGKYYYNKIAINSGNAYYGIYGVGASGTFANNFVSALNDMSARFDNNNADIYYNTFYATSSNYAVYINTPNGGNFKRNICYNDGTGYAIQITPKGIPSSNKNKNNGLAAGFASESNDFFTKGATLGRYNVTNCATLAAWRTASGMDANSVNQPAVFLSATDLRLTQVNDLLYFTTSLGLPAEIEQNDIVGNVRSNIFYIGAHTIVPNIAIVQQPKPIVNCYGATGQMFIVVATIEYGGSLTYQWQKDGVDIPGATTAILALPSLTHEMPGIYSCTIKGNGGAKLVQSVNALLYTLRTTKITRQPDNSMVDLGETARFDLDVHVYDNDPKDYQPKCQWYRDTVALKDNDRINGTQSSILTIRDIQASDYDVNYSVIISGLCGSDQSVPITISARPKISIKTEPDTVLTVCEGLSAQVKVEAEVNMPVSMNYQWRFNGVPLDNDGHYMGVNTPILSISAVKATDGGNYDCVITLDKGVDVKTTIVSRLDVKLLPAIARQPIANVIVKKDAALNIDFEAQGFAPLHYAWFKNGAPTGDSVAVFTRATAAPTDEGSYICKVWNDCGEIWTKECAVTVTTAIYMGYNDAVVGGYTLQQNQPNPFAATTTIGIIAPQAGNVVLSITDVFGREVKTLNLKLNEGFNNVEINANDITNGVYNYNLNINGFQASRRMVIVK